MSDNGDRRLNSWKEIGAFFGKDERTVKRWESQRGLPIHRIPGGARASVFAYASELEGWLKGEGQGSNGANGSPASAAAPSPSRHALAAAALVAAFLVVAGLAYLARRSVDGEGAARQTTSSRPRLRTAARRCASTTISPASSTGETHAGEPRPCC